MLGPSYPIAIQDERGRSMRITTALPSRYALDRFEVKGMELTGKFSSRVSKISAMQGFDVLRSRNVCDRKGFAR